MNQLLSGSRYVNASLTLLLYSFISVLPQPIVDNVKLEERSLSRVAVIQFGGWATQIRVADYQKKLETRINELNLSKIGNFMVAQYNSPWALPPFRHNEVLVQVK